MSHGGSYGGHSGGHSGGWSGGHHNAGGSHHSQGSDSGYWGVSGTGSRRQNFRWRLANAVFWLVAVLAVLLILSLTGH